MNSRTPQLQYKNLRRAESPSSYELYRAALEWDLVEPILIEDRKDLKSEPKWRDNIEPYHHQVKNLVTFCRRLPVTLLADDVGLGKTISAGLVASELMSRNRISKILVVCPKLLMPQWKEELETKFGIPGVMAIGKDLIEAKPPADKGAVITTYNSARLYLDAVGRSGFDMLVLDEAHKLRNLHGVEHAPQVAQRFRQALADRIFRYVLMLTATPIQNRLWDLYSLVDLLTVARGHQNPFGTPGKFSQTFIADSATQARHLNPHMKDEFRSIVYGYMSRVRRADARLYFPERVVQLHRVKPTNEELQLIELIAVPIQKLNRLAQISILQAVVSSPQALNSQLRKMASNGTVPESLARNVDDVVKNIRTTAKLEGLGSLIGKLQAEQPEKWRMVVFTTRRETQTAIESYLGERGISYGLINGDSGVRNQETIAKFKKAVPEVHVIVSTEAGSEGVNLQAANVLVNYDLPWNPMVVEQRIGRIQRLASEHASVCIFNIILRGTFEEYIVGRLMEKLQMAAHAIGDVESLLDASGMNDHKEDGSASFEEKIRELVIASLAGKNVEAATQLTEKSITDAKTELEVQEKNINDMLAGIEGTNRKEIPLPHLPVTQKSMGPETFVLSALESLGNPAVESSPGLYRAQRDGKVDFVCFDETIANSFEAVLYKPGAPAFSRLVQRITLLGLHRVEDTDAAAQERTEKIVKEWVTGFGARYVSSRIQDVQRSFAGTALVRVRATVAHDSYERLVEVPFPVGEYWSKSRPNAIDALPDSIERLEDLGIDASDIAEKATMDGGIAQFCRFYRDRLEQELQSAGDDPRKRKKLEDDFTPRLETSLVGLDGTVRRKISSQVTYELGPGVEYKSVLAVIPSVETIADAPALRENSQTGAMVPSDCLGKCEISGAYVLKHLLIRSSISERSALPEHTAVCALTGKRVLRDELEPSSVTGQLVISSSLETSAASGKKAEPRYFRRCEFSDVSVLEGESATSQISGKTYRVDEQLRSAVSGRTGHRREFVLCTVTGQPITREEAEQCEVTGKLVAPGVLERCEVSGKRVVPRELEKSATSGRKALRTLFVSSSISGARILEEEAVRSVTGKYCTSQEAKTCMWSGTLCHPEDLRTCEMTGIHMHLTYSCVTDGRTRLEPLTNLLNGVCRKADRSDLWERVIEKVSNALRGRSRIEAAELSPDHKNLAVSIEVKNWLGLKTRQAGLVFSIQGGVPVGRVVCGKREQTRWKFEDTL
jgi:superfamily II DNA or RNA helicase